MRTYVHSGGITYNEAEEFGSLTQQSASETSAMAPLVCFAEDSPAKTSPSPDDAQDSEASDPVSSSSSHESLTLFSDRAAGSSLRMFPDSFPPKADEISPSYSRRWASSGFTTSPGECWTADTSECPSGGGAYSSLRDVLEADVPARFYLSQKAAAGILRRAERRGKALPKALEMALRTLSEQNADHATISTTTPTSPTPSEAKDSTPQGTERDEAPPWSFRPTVRRLTPTECERLQSLPDGWTWVR
jgi:site-specific DNA-cytosine methylase